MGSEAHFGEGTKLTVLENEVSKRNEINVTIIKPSEKELCKKTVTLVCAAKNFYPDHVSITWTVRGTPRTDGVATDPYATKEKTGNKYTISSRLKVTKKEWNNAKNEFSCILNFYNGTDTWKVPNENQVFGIGEDYVKSSQWVKLSYGMVIAKSGLYGLVIFVVHMESEELKMSYKSTCTSYAKLEFGEGTKLTVLATNITLPKVKILPPSPREICSQKETDSNLTLVCVATGFYPDHVSLTWKVNGKEREDSVSTDSIAHQDNMTLLYHISSRMKVSKNDWMDPGSIFTCTVRFYNGEDYVNVANTIKGQKEKPKGLKLLGLGYIVLLFKSLLYALVVSGVVWKLKFSMKMKPLPEY
ncbi:uncharacterized protein LOC143746341 [Siphateles boraxobius]|uniref:uncharacterized protein LOC143746341 n=1 Tax=Siphateles boraxobius TaxID=180520 RepID=UPI0040638475